MTALRDHAETLFEIHAKRYLREAKGDKRKARRELLADRAEAASHLAPFYDAALKALEALE